MAILKTILQAGGSLLLGKDKTPEEVEFNLSTLDKKSQYLKSVARPVILISIVFTLILGVIIQWLQQVFKAEYIIVIPVYFYDLTEKIVLLMIGGRSLEKIIKGVLKK